MVGGQSILRASYAYNVTKVYEVSGYLPLGDGSGSFVDDGENLFLHLCCEFLGAGDAR